MAVISNIHKETMATNNSINIKGPTPLFLATNFNNQTNVTGDLTAYTVQFTTSLYDTTSSFNTGTGIFTAPVAGYYSFQCLFLPFGITTQTDYQGYFQTSSSAFQIASMSELAGFTISEITISGSISCYMNAGDTMEMIFSAGLTPKTISISGMTGYGPAPFFSGNLIMVI